MATLDGTRLRDLVKKVLGFGDASSDDSLVENVLVRPYARWSAHKALTDAAASNAYRMVLDAGLDVRAFIDEVKVVCDTDVTANGSNYATIALVYNDAAAGSDTTIGTLSTASTGFTAKIARSMTLTASAQAVASGKQLELVVTKAGSGVSIPGLSVVVKGKPI